MFGFFIGTLAGFLGVGGGFMLTPYLFALGIRMEVAVGTSLGYTAGVSALAATRHGRLGHADFKLACFMTPGALVGVEIGARTIEFLKQMGSSATEMGVGLAYVVTLSVISLYTLRETLKSGKDGFIAGRNRILSGIRKMKIPPMVSLPKSGIPSVSMWGIVSAGLMTGIAIGFMGTGGGFTNMAMLLYVVGCRTIVAVGTSLLGVTISSAYGSFSHALKGNLDITLVMITLAGGIIGAPLGVTATRHVEERRIRLLFGFCTGLTATSLFLQLFAKASGIIVLARLSQAILGGTIAVASMVVVASWLFHWAQAERIV